MLDRFSVSDIAGLQERQLAFSQLEKLGSVWIGSDITIEKPVVVKEGKIVPTNLVINRNNLPPIEITRGALRSLDISVRSFYAQTGIEIMFHGGNVSNEALQDLNSGKDISIPIDIINHGQRPVEVDGNVMRFFWANDRKRLRKQDLINQIKSGEFLIDGVEGEDWYLGGSDEEQRFTTENGSKDALCVIVRLKPERYYIPYKSEPVKKR
jgi:hypothetical protein